MSKFLDFELLLHPEVQRFIREHEDTDEKALVLKQKEILGVSSAWVAQQIVGRRKAKAKLNLLYSTQYIIYPPKLNLEQCSSEATARFKSEIISGKTAIDLTGGLGIDSLFLSKKFKAVTHIEKDESLLRIARHNHDVLGVSNIEHKCAEAETYLSVCSETFDLIYIDPSRRSASNKKVFKFADCSPNVVALLPQLLAKARHVLIKASPLIDIKEGIKELGFVQKVFVVGFDNECKEVLFLIEGKNSETTIEAADLSDPKNKSSFTFTLLDERKAVTIFSEPQHYLYEPSAMVLKAGAFKLVANRFDLKKIAPNTHLYTSNELVHNFPGRIFTIQSYLKSDAKSVAKLLPEGCANVTTRNYPLTPPQLKKKLKLQDGGEQFVIGFSGIQKKYLVLAQRVK